MTAEWWAIAGLFTMVVSQDYRQSYERSRRFGVRGSAHLLFAWAVSNILGVGLFVWGAWLAAHR